MKIQSGTKFKINTAEGLYQYRVLYRETDTRRSTYGYWKVRVDSGHPARINQVDMMSEKEILAALKGDS